MLRVTLNKQCWRLVKNSTGRTLAYLQPNRPYLQRSISGGTTSLTCVSATGARSGTFRGAVVPGTCGCWRSRPLPGCCVEKTGYQIQYAPTARWTKDLDRFVYFSYSINNKFRDWRPGRHGSGRKLEPYYTGTKMAHVVGWRDAPGRNDCDRSPNGPNHRLQPNQIPGGLTGIYSADWWKPLLDGGAVTNDHRACEWQAPLAKTDWRHQWCHHSRWAGVPSHDDIGGFWSICHRPDLRQPENWNSASPIYQHRNREQCCISCSEASKDHCRGLWRQAVRATNATRKTSLVLHSER